MATALDERQKKSIDADRQPRAMENRAVTEDRKISDDDRLAMFRQTLFQERLPNLPKLEGYHVCWLSTNNPTDSIQTRQLLGYEQITLADVPGWDHASIKTGEMAGMIAVNEMLAYKIPNVLYQKYMTESHQDAPNREAQKLTDTVKFIEDQKRSKRNSAAEISEDFREEFDPLSRPVQFD